MFKSVGKRVPRFDGIGHVTGKTVYPSDLTMPGMLVCKTLRNPYHCTRIHFIDTTEAEKVPGVHSVITHKDVPHNLFSMVPDHHVLAEDIARYKGQNIVAVAAVDKATALEALSKVKIEMEELPYVTDPVEAMIQSEGFEEVMLKKDLQKQIS